MKTEQQISKSEVPNNNPKGKSALLSQHEDLKYIDETLADLPVKQLEYVRTLVDNHLSEKRSRKKLVKPFNKQAAAKKLGRNEPLSTYDMEREDESDYI